MHEKERVRADEKDELLPNVNFLIDFQTASHQFIELGHTICLSLPARWIL